MQTVLMTPTFERSATRAGLSDFQIQDIAATLASNPTAGVLMVGTGGLRKLRFARDGKGKSGGFRTLHYYAGDDIPISLLDLIDKSESSNLSKAARNAIAKALPLLVSDYRNSKSGVPND